LSDEIETYRALLLSRYQELDDLLADLPDEALLWRPFETSPWRGPANSLGYIVAHAVSSTTYLLRRVEWVLGRRNWEAVDGDEGPEEFGPANHEVGYLRERCWRTYAEADSFLDSLSAGDLETRWQHWTEGVRGVRYDIMHAIEHMSEHIGQAQLTRQLWALQSA
jgi:hypothetical protein